MPGWEQLGMQAASQGISGALGLVLGNINDRRQLRQQEKLQNLQIKGDKQLTDYNFLKQMEMWRNTNYPAQMAMMKAAGLNPALMYEGGGQGGSTAITQGTVTGGNPPTGGGEIMQMMAMGLTRDLQLAQIENIKAQTAKTQAETTNVPLTGQNIQADTKVKEVTEANLNIANDIAGATQNAQKALIIQAMRKSWEELEMTQELNNWNEKQLEANFKLATANIVEAYAKSRLTDQQTNLTKEQITQVTEAIKQAWSNIDIAATNAQTQQKLMEFTTGMGPQAASFVGDIIRFITELIPQRSRKK